MPWPTAELGAVARRRTSRQVAKVSARWIGGNRGGTGHVQGTQDYPSERWEARCVRVFNLRE